jgi:pimeloyl-ACP methyl ester carboxylesterase
MVPQFDGLAKFRLSGHEIDEVTAAIAELRRRSDRVAVAGFSFGAGPALIAAAKHDGLAWVGSFGGYADLTNVIVFLTTGVHRWDGRRHTGPVEEYNRWKLLALLAPLVQDERDRERLLLIASRRLANPFDDVNAILAALGRDGRIVMSLVESRQEDVTMTLLGRLSPATRAALDRLSVAAAVPKLRTRLWLVHGTADDSIPFTESLRLANAAGSRARAVILESFHHTGPASTWTRLHRRVTDAAALFRLVDEILRAAGRSRNGA